MVLLIIFVALLQPTLLQGQSASLGVDGGSGVRPVGVDRIRGNAMFSLSSLEPLGATWQTDQRGARLLVNGETLTFEFGSPYFRVAKDVFQLIAPARRNGRTVQVSTQLITEWLPARYASTLSLHDGILRRRQPAPAPAPANPTPKPALAPAHAPGGSGARVVVIDAGHGGNDPGKVGSLGLAEKNVTLTVATKLAALLRDNGYEVHLTRTADTLISLADRPRLANQWKNGRPATLFISIHANAGVPEAEGFETYFLSEARTEDERRVAEMENSAVTYEDRRTTKQPAIDQVLTSLRNDYYQHASNDFAEVIQRELGAFHPGKSRGVKQAGFRVLVGAVMPAVLVEIAFISSPNEARLLGSTSFQDKIAYSLARSISNFFTSHEHLWIAEPNQ